ncbi:MAG: hypothetical protein AAGF11_18015 [Myxococcota bacterium]
MLASLLLPTGCASNLGSRSLPEVRINYMESIARSSEEQILLNIVRLRHLHLPVFLQVSSVVTQFSLSTNVGASGSYNVVTPGGPVPTASAGASAGVAIQERPTISYTPLQGADFVQRMATPLSVDAIVHLVHAGWPWDSVLDCCVQQVNGLFAPPRSQHDTNSDFQRLAAALHGLQRAHGLSVSTNERGEHELVFALPATDEGRQLAAEARQLLGLDAEAYRYRLARQWDPADSRSITFQGRSMLATLYYLSYGVEASAAGQTAPLGDDALLRVRVARQAPRDAYASVVHGRQSFYIASDDAASQRVFMLVTYLFNLMATPGGGGPLLTVSTGS